MKHAIGWWFGLAGMLSAGNLSFSEPVREFTLKPEETQVVADYPFTNRSNETVVVKDFKVPCPCLSLQISGGKKAYGPGESGVIRVNFDATDYSGKIDQELPLWLEGDAEASPSVKLGIRVEIPMMVEMEPKAVKWEVGEAPEPKKIQITMKGDKPIHIKAVEALGAFTHEMKTIEDGRRYEITIKPPATERPALSAFKIQTDSPLKRYSLVQVYGAVRSAQQAPAPVPSATPPAK